MCPSEALLKAERRGTLILQHQAHHTQTTDRMGNIHLVFSQEYNTLEEAKFIERRLKKLKRKDYLQKIIDDGYIKIYVA